jgi:uridine kinase
VGGGHRATVDLLVQRIEELRRNGPGPVLVALDGRSGAGKSTLAAAVGSRTGALVIDGDDFYSGGSDEYWDALDVRRKMDLVIDWRRQRAVLEQLRRGRPATWRAYDWDADNGCLGERITAGPVGIVILDGSYSSRPELADHLTMRVLLEVDRDVRRDRLLRREGERYRAEWEARWGAAEDLYFRTVMPPGAFDLVLDGR